jgi:rubrerythrin
VIEELTLKKAVAFAVQTEELAAHFYKRLAHRFADDEELSAIFTKLLEDEKRHAQRFAELGRDLPAEHPEQYRQKQYLRAIALSEIFSDEKGIAKQIEAIGSRDEALQRVLELEKTTLLYYEGMRPLLGDSPALEWIIAEEQQHVIQITSYLAEGTTGSG